MGPAERVTGRECPYLTYPPLWLFVAWGFTMSLMRWLQSAEAGSCHTAGLVAAWSVVCVGM